MPSNYTGDPRRMAPHAAPTITCPVDADPANAASVNTPLQKLANYVAFLQAHAALLDVAEVYTALRTFNGAPGDANGVLATAPLVTARKNVWELSVGGAGEHARLYLNRDGELEFTRNAWWDAALSKWRADVWAPGPAWCCSRLVLASTGLVAFAHGDPTLDVRDAANAWPTAAWRRVTQLGQDGAVEFFGTSATAGGTNPPAHVPQANRLVAKNTCKAWGSVHLHAGVATLEDGFNASVAMNWNTVRVTLGTSMASPSFAVLLTDANRIASGAGSGSGLPPSCYAKSKDGAAGLAYFDVVYPGVDLTKGHHAFDFLVFGQQDS